MQKTREREKYKFNNFKKNDFNVSTVLSQAHKGQTRFFPINKSLLSFYL